MSDPLFPVSRLKDLVQVLADMTRQLTEVVIDNSEPDWRISPAAFRRRLQYRAAVCGCAACRNMLMGIND